MKILFIGTTDFGGVSSYVSTIIKNSKNIGFYLLKDNMMNESSLNSLYPNCTFINLPQNYSFFVFIKTLILLRNQIIKHEIDLVHAHTLRAGFQASMLKYFFCNKIKLVYTGHGLRYTQKKNYIISLIFMNLEKVTQSISDKVIFIRKTDFNISLKKRISESYKSIYIKTQISLPKESSQLIDIREKYNIKTKYIVLNAGSIYDIKNPNLFIEIAKKTLISSRDITFIWFGDGVSRLRLNQILKSEGLFDYIKFVGPISKEQMLSIYSQIDIFLLTSKVETFPTVILESFLSNKLVFSSNFKGVEEIISNGKTGFIYDFKNIDHTSKLIINLLNDKTKYKYITENAKQNFKDNFNNVSDFAKIHTQIYKQLVK